MNASLSRISRRRPGRSGRWARLALERLEARTLFAGHTLATATLLTPGPLGTAQTSGFLATANEDDFYRIHLDRGDVLSLSINSQASGGSLQSLLSVLDATGKTVAHDAQQGGDPRLTFQASAAGDYFLDVTDANATTGLYELDLRRQPGVPLTADLAGSSFRLTTDTAAYGDTLTGTFTIENRGGAETGAFDVQVVLSGPSMVGPSIAMATYHMSGIGTGQECTESSFSATLPDLATATAAGLPISGLVAVGLRIDPAGAVPELNLHYQSGVHRGEDWEKLTVLTPVAASGQNHTPATAMQLPNPDSQVSGSLTAGQSDWYQLTVPATGRWKVEITVTKGTLLPLLTLAGPDGQVLVQSGDAIAPGSVQPGTYDLAVSTLSGAGSYHLSSEFVQGNSPFDFAPLGHRPLQIVMADVNGDGIPDLVSTNYSGAANSVSVLLSNGDGTFAAPKDLPVGNSPAWLTVTDVNGDGKPDIVVANFHSNTVSVLLGNGDGTFQAQEIVPVGRGPSQVAVADINGDEIPDLITGNQFDSTVSFLLGNGNGTFHSASTLALDSGTPLGNVAVAVADFNRDGLPDIVTVNDRRSSTIDVFFGNGDETFQPERSFSVGIPLQRVPETVTVADFNGDGIPDLLLTNNGGANVVSVLLGNGDGSFQAEKTYPGSGLNFGSSVAVADLNGDGKLDIVTATGGVLLGNGDGTFGVKAAIFGPEYELVAVADVNGDGIPDLVGERRGSGSAGVHLGKGDGTFLPLPSRPMNGFAVGKQPPTPGETVGNSVTVADLAGDGKLDVVTANYSDNTVSELVGNGDGTFGPQQTFPTGKGPYAVAVADLNGDGKPDLVTANFVESTLSVLLGNGNGTFGSEHTVAVGNGPFAVTVVDVNGDGKPDIVIANYGDQTVSVLLGDGDGTFGPPKTFPIGAGIQSLAVADVNGDGKPDIITTSYTDNTVSVLLGNGDGTFGARHTFAVGSGPRTVAVADVNGDGKPDIVTFNYKAGGSVSVLLGNGDGTFQPQQRIVLDKNTVLAAAADVNGDGKPDLVIVNGAYKTVSVLLGKGDGSFGSAQFSSVGVGLGYTAVAVADINGDGKPDLVATNHSDQTTVSVLLGHGDGTFSPPTHLISSVGPRNTPYLADFTGDGLPDSVVLDRSGNILYRKGLPGADSPFAPPVILNKDRPARDLTVLRTSTGWAIATADARFDPKLSSANHFVYTVSLYAVASGGRVTLGTAFSTTLTPTYIATADLSGNGLDDIVVADSFDNTVQVALQQPDGTFSVPLTLPTGEDPSDLALVDVNGDGLTDIVVSNQASGDVTVFLNDKNHTFTTSYRFRSGTSLYGLDTTDASPTISTIEQSVSLAAGDFTGHGRNDVVVVNRGAHSFTVLPNDGRGGFAEPQAALTTSTSDGLQVNQQPGPVVAGDFNGDGLTDVAVLMQDTAQVWIYTNQGHGTFVHTFTITAGTAPTGLNLFRNPHTGQLDVLVGNQFGDVLHLQGKGDGTFQLPGNRTSLDVQNLGHGKTGVLVANQRTDRITVQASSGGSAFAPVVTLADGTRSTLAPGAVYWAKLDQNSPYYDAVVVASGGNAALVYRGTGFDAKGAPTFATPVSYSVGTDPVSLTVADINGDGIPDMLVADRGSNDVAELFGASDSQGHWTATAGPRLASGGSGPIAVNLVADANSPGGFDLAVTNGLSGTVAMLSGRGQGFFDDRTPQIVALNTPVAGGPTIVAGEAVFPTLDGALVGFDLATLSNVHTVFDSTEVGALGELPDGDLAVAQADGNVDLLRWDGTLGLFDLEGSLSPLSGLPSEPSALAVLQSDNGLRVLVTQAGSNALFVFALPSTDSGPPAVSTTASESVPLPLPASLAVVLTLLSNPLPADTVPAAPTEPAVVPVAAAEAMLAHGSAESGGGDEPDAPEDIALFVSPFAGPNPVEALEKLRLFGPGSETDTAPPPERGPKPAEPPPVPRSSVPPVAPPDLVWADVSWLDNALPACPAAASVTNATFSPGEQDATPCLNEAPLAAASLVSPAWALVGLVGFRETWGWPERADNRRTRSSRAVWLPEVNCP